jgi:fibro-slime domain-containing protein
VTLRVESKGRTALRWFWLALVCCLPLKVHAAKVVRYFSMAGDTSIYVIGGTFGNATPGSVDSLRMIAQPDGWLQIAVPPITSTSMNYSNVGFSQKDWRNQTSRVDLTAAFAASDTAWVIPEPFPTGTGGLKVLTSRPKIRTVMFWNPWLNPAAVPWMHLEGGKGVKMSPSASATGWYQLRTMGFTKMQLLFTDSAGTRNMGAAGAGLPAPFFADSIADNSDTIWIRGVPEAGATGARVTAKQPVSKLIMVYNPWTGRLPIERPLVTMGTDGPFKPVADLEFCGWYRYAYFDRTPLLSLRSTRGGSWGAKGFGDSTGIDVSAIGDTAWVSVRPDSLPRVTKSPTSDRGLCEATLLAATIRDFASNRKRTDPLTNREFKFADTGRGCWKGGYGVVKGMVDSILGSDHKPVRSAHDTGAGYPNSWSWAFRCTYDTLHDGKAEIGDSGISTNWFRTVPTKNSETCRDIPLVLNDTTGAYEYDNQNYFPIDDFKTRANGTPNPFYDTIRQNEWDAQSYHNYGFCLESHGNFEYKKKQVFRFRGDDDVWFFINNKLVVDLGGIHGPAEDSVFLDSVGATYVTRLDSLGKPIWDNKNNRNVVDLVWTSNRLVEGKTYPFDFFFCERHPAGSSLRIRTQMNLRTDARFQVMDTLRASGNTSYDLYVSTTSGQGCQARTNLARATGVVRISGPPFAVPKQLSSKLWYGGILVDSAEGRVQVDSSKIVGLPAGTYTLQFVYLRDSTVLKEYSFIVPYTAGPRFVSTPPYSGVVGSSFPVEIGAFNTSGIDSSAVQFVLQAPNGIELYRDSLLTSKIGPGDTLLTGIKGISRRVWVKGTFPWTYTLVVGKIAGDSADIYGGIVFKNKGLRFLDSSGTVLAPVPAIDRLLGDTVRIYFETFAGESTCTKCGSRVVFRSNNPGIVFVGGDTVALIDGRGNVQIKGVGTAKDDTIFASVVGDASSLVVWTPVSFRVLPPDSSILSDRNHDGRADQLDVWLRQAWTDKSRFSFSWPDSTHLWDALQGKITVSPDSLHISVDLGTMLPAGVTASGAKGLRGNYAWGSEATQPVTVIERIAPIPVRAFLRYGQPGLPDSLFVMASEGLQVKATALLQTSSLAGWSNVQATDQLVDATGYGIYALFDPTHPELCPIPGDSVRFADGSVVADLLGNAVQGQRVAVIIEGGQRPPLFGWYQDKDGDGRIDQATVQFFQPVRGTVPMLSFRPPFGVAGDMQMGACSVSSDSTKVTCALPSPLPAGTTSFLPTYLGNMDDQWNFMVRDSVPPVVVSAQLHLTESYTEPDTLVILASEPLALQMASAWILKKQGNSDIQLTSPHVQTSSMELRFLISPDDVQSVRAGDSVRFVIDGGVKDTLGNIPTSSARWVRILGGMHKPLSKLIPPVPVVRLDNGALPVRQKRPLQFLTSPGDTSVWVPWSADAGASQEPSPCTQAVCNHLELQLNSPVRVDLHIYDAMGTFVTSVAEDIDSSALAALVKDRLGRARVRISWDHRSQQGTVVTDGIYLMRLVLTQPAVNGNPGKLVNQIWKVGFTSKK